MKTFTITLADRTGHEGEPVMVQASSRVEAAMRGALTLGLAETVLRGDGTTEVRFTHTGTVKVRQSG
jgi:hypothetical protein